MIKPIRRLKLLQIFYNAIHRHNNRLQHIDEQQEDDGTESLDSGYRRGSTVDASTEYDSDSDIIVDEKRQQSTAEMASETYSSLTPLRDRSRSSSPISSSSSSGPSVSLKRRRGLEVSSDTTSDLETKRIPKTQKSLGGDPVVTKGRAIANALRMAEPKITLTNVDAENDLPRNLGLSGADIGVDYKSFPKRTRNNDALTLLLTPEELGSCRGKNVLVAEDDFVSQKILEK
jgi:hypothetical protein